MINTAIQVYALEMDEKYRNELEKEDKEFKYKFEKELGEE